jgi:predicted dehydrogenase
MTEIRIGFIGAGRISDLHAIEYLQNPHTRIVAVCDADTEIGRRQAAKWGVPSDRVYTDYHKLLACNDIDLVDILLPHHLHFPAALAVLEAGKHVSLQKPMTLTLDEADRLIATASRQQVRFRVFENFIFYPPVMKAKQLIDTGTIGEPLTIRIKSNAGKGRNAWAVPAAAERWRRDPASCGGGPLTFDDGHHKFALAWYFMGMAEEVHAWIGQTTAASGALLDSPALISWKFPGDRYGTLEVVYSRDLEIHTRHYPQDDRVEITGTKGVIWINQGHGRIGNQAPVILYADGETRAFSDMETGWEWSFVYSTRHLIEAMLNDTPHKLSGEEGREILRFALAAQHAAQQNRTILLDGWAGS